MTKTTWAILAAMVGLLAARWIHVWLRRRADDRAFGAAIRNRNDVRRYLGDNE